MFVEVHIVKQSVNQPCDTIWLGLEHWCQPFPSYQLYPPLPLPPSTPPFLFSFQHVILKESSFHFFFFFWGGGGRGYLLFYFAYLCSCLIYYIVLLFCCWFFLLVFLVFWFCFLFVCLFCFVFVSSHFMFTRIKMFRCGLFLQSVRKRLRFKIS